MKHTHAEDWYRLECTPTGNLISSILSRNVQHNDYSSAVLIYLFFINSNVSSVKIAPYEIPGVYCTCCWHKDPDQDFFVAQKQKMQ